jgi:uncharacterized protein YegP (UPF0339 family)
VTDTRIVHADDLVGYALISLLFKSFGKTAPPIHKVFDLEKGKTMKDKVEVTKDNAGEYRWSRKNGENGKVVSTSAEGYKHKSHALRMAKELNPGAHVVDKSLRASDE